MINQRLKNLEKAITERLRQSEEPDDPITVSIMEFIECQTGASFTEQRMHPEINWMKLAVDKLCADRAKAK